MGGILAAFIPAPGALFEVSRHQRLAISFVSAAALEFACKTMLNLKANGREATLTVGAFDEIRMEQLQRFNPVRIEIQSLNFDDAFVETVGPADRESS